MREIKPPLFGMYHDHRAFQRRAVFQRELDRLIEAAVAAGWREAEIALEVADLAEDYVMKLAKSDGMSFANDNTCKN